MTSLLGVDKWIVKIKIKLSECNVWKMSLQGNAILFVHNEIVNSFGTVRIMRKQVDTASELGHPTMEDK